MLTRKQYELLMYVDRHLKQTGFSPSFEEMKDALNLKSKSGIHRLISALEERGFLGRRRHRARALEVLRLPENAAGRPGKPNPDSGTYGAGSMPSALRQDRYSRSGGWHFFRIVIRIAGGVLDNAKRLAAGAIGIDDGFCATNEK